jgi:hypothetical protein
MTLVWLAIGLIVIVVLYMLSVATLLDGTFFTIADGTGTGPRAHS